MKYKRICPRCGKNIICKSYKQLWQQNSRNSVCLKCRPKKLSESLKNRKFTAEWKQNLRKNHADFSGKNNPFYGKRHTKKTTNQISQSRKGKCTGDDSPTKRPEFRKWMSENNPMNDPVIREKCHKNCIKGMKSPVVRKKMRIKRLEQLKNGDSVPSFNKNACQYFDELNKKNGWKGQHALNGGEKMIAGYSVDYYEPRLNMVIEWDEPHHYKGGQLREEDVIRQRNIINEVQCKFYRIKQNTLEMYEVRSDEKDK